MNELDAIVAAARNAVHLRQTAVLATVVDTAGSSYRQPGARMLVTDDGWQAGSISGGCLEGDIVRRGAWLTAGGNAVVLTYDTTDDDDMIHGLGLGCRGVIRVLIERLNQTAQVDLIGFLHACRASRSAAVVATVIQAADGTAVGRRLLLRSTQTAQPMIMHDIPDGDLLFPIRDAVEQALRQQRSLTLSFEARGGNVEAFVEFIPPATPLVIFGAGHDVMPLVKFAKALAFYVTVIDGRPAYAKASRFPEADRVILCAPAALETERILTPDAIALVMTHSYQSDRMILQALLASQAKYIGVLGPKKRLHEMLSDIDEEGFPITDAHLQRLYAPVGLDIGAANTEQVALSIMAEIQAVLTGRHGGHLRERSGPIHADNVSRVTLHADASSLAGVA